MQTEPAADSTRLAALRARLAGLHVRPCAMAHERIVRGADGLPLSDDRTDGGYRRPSICPAALRADHLGCSHTGARIVLFEVLSALGEGSEPLRDALNALDGAFSLLDHRRYDAETRRAEAVRAEDGEGVAAAEAAIAALVAEHHTYGRRVAEIRDAVLLRLDAASPALPSAVAAGAAGLA